MGTVMVDVSMSLDGYIAGPNVGQENPMGEGGMRLHKWLFSSSSNPVDSAVSKGITATIGAVVLGNTTFKFGLAEWGDNTPYPVPSFVVTHHPQDQLVTDTGTFTFVTDGVAKAVAQATDAAGDKKVLVMGADLTDQVISAGLLDEMHIHLVPLLLGSGARLFDRLELAGEDWRQAEVVGSDIVTHLHYVKN